MKGKVFLKLRLNFDCSYSLKSGIRDPAIQRFMVDKGIFSLDIFKSTLQVHEGNMSIDMMKGMIFTAIISTIASMPPSRRPRI